MTKHHFSLINLTNIGANAFEKAFVMYKTAKLQDPASPPIVP